MVFDAREVLASRPNNFDLIIVGSGAAGITLALALRRAGIRIALIEAGSERFSAEGQQIFAADAISPATHSPTHMYRQRRLGGSTALWGGRCIPFDPIDFEHRPWLSHAQWPFSYDEIARHYPCALRIAEAGLPEFHAEAAFPGSAGPMIDGITSTDVVLDRIERFSKPSHFGKIWRDELERANDLEVYINAPVTQLLIGPDAQARGVRIALPTGEVELNAPKVVVAVGGIETARLLLSSNETHPAGLGNGHDLVGRFYQCHLEGEVGHLHFMTGSGLPRLDYQRSHDNVYCRRYIWLSPEAQRRDHLAGLVMRPGHASIVDPLHRHPVLSAMYLVKNFIVPEYARKMTALEHKVRSTHRSGLSFYGAHIGNILRGAPQLASFGANWLMRRTLADRKLPSVVLKDPRNAYPADINAEQEPNFASRITLGEDHDALGMRRVRVDWRATSADFDRMSLAIKRIASAFGHSSAARYEIDGIDATMLRDLIVPIGGHHVGTARMADTPHNGVCDSHGEVFGIKGLFIAGAAAFPTSGFANPTLTLIALTLRLAEHLAPERVASI